MLETNLHNAKEAQIPFPVLNKSTYQLGAQNDSHMIQHQRIQERSNSVLWGDAEFGRGNWRIQSNV